MRKNYIENNDPEIENLVRDLCKGISDEKAMLERIFNYVRDDIEFAFLKEADDLTATQVLEYGKGQCNNKSILFHTLLKSAGLKSRIHFSSIKKEIHFGLFRGLVYKLMPNEISHSWVEVKIDGGWIVIDNYINDLKFYKGGKRKLQSEGRLTGYSVSCVGGKSSPELDLKSEKICPDGGSAR